MSTAAEIAAPVRCCGGQTPGRFGGRYVSCLFVDVVGRRLLRVNEEADTQQERRAGQVHLAGSVYDEVLTIDSVPSFGSSVLNVV
ncbi:hypothetical protein ACWGIV_22570 [Streptomyces sp. NPDC054844]